jgi:hypothetical protein
VIDALIVSVEELEMDFFIGYNWPLSAATSRFVTRVGVGLAVGALGLAGALAVGHRQLEGGNFEFGRVTEHAGTLVEHPVPMLRPLDGRGKWPLLVAIGKHGAHEVVRARDGAEVVVRGTRIVRGDREMLELASLSGAGLKSRPHAGRTDVQASSTVVRAGLQSGPPSTTITVTGEIVDSKCFLGVMVPGEGITHRQCAALCLRGGIPAALNVEQPDGTSAVYLIACSAATRDRSVAWAGETVEMTGTVMRQGGWLVLTTEPGAWRRLAR